MSHGRIAHMRRFVVTLEDVSGYRRWLRLEHNLDGNTGELVSTAERWDWSYSQATRMLLSEAEGWCADYNRRITTHQDAQPEEIDDDMAAVHDALVIDRED